MADQIRVIQYGLGPIGSAIARHVTERHGLRLVGGVDIDPGKVGRDVGQVIGLQEQLGFPVTELLSQTLRRTGADLVLHTTTSYLDLFRQQILDILAAELDIVSTAEQLSFPWLAHPDEATEIDTLAKRVGKTVLATGINPGFLMDSLPLSLTAICQRLDHIEVRRVINASTRRLPFQIKIGAGLTVDEFRARIAGGRMGHVGLAESIGMVFHTLGKTLANYTSTVEPIVADELISGRGLEVQPGQVRGLRQVARAHTPEGEFMALTFVAALEQEDEGDTIRILGKPDLAIRLTGTNGDVATVAIAVNAIRRVREASPGLVTMADIPLITHW